MLTQGSGQHGPLQGIRGTVAVTLRSGSVRETCEASGKMVLSFILIQNRQYVNASGTTAPTFHGHARLTLRNLEGRHGWRSGMRRTA
jgi:hypothetical protein